MEDDLNTKQQLQNFYRLYKKIIGWEKQGVGDKDGCLNFEKNL